MLMILSLLLAAAPVVTFSEGLQTPESVLYDSVSDTYLVSNINGKPTAKDNNGFISELNPDGSVANLKLVAGGENKVTLHAPKGMALVDGILYVADIDTVRMFERKPGLPCSPKGEVKIPRSSFLNDVAAGPDGKIYVSDSGLKADFSGSGTDAIYEVTNGKKVAVRALVKNKSLSKPNGLFVTKDGIYMVPFGGKELMSFDLNGKPLSKKALPVGQIDGLLMNGDDIYVSSWESKSVLKGSLTTEFTPLIENIDAPADIGFDSKRNRILVPRFSGNLVQAFSL
jgi:sugar lactone lactonase YvrE